MVKKATATKPVTKSVSKSTGIKLSQARLDTLAMIEDPKAREALRSKWIAAVKAQQEKNALYLQRRNDLQFVQTELGFLAVNGTGTRRNAIFSKAQGLEFLERIEEFRTAVHALPDVTGESEDTEDAE